jgi:hypothetical protein
MVARLVAFLRLTTTRSPPPVCLPGGDYHEAMSDEHACIHGLVAFYAPTL